ncbi:DegT/DnrJ/EryC1/StrS family aminotransferase, partial [Candidatus Pacearchaeota archaeon]|nr:DegT/DnrJ/EryC1/StrS family aminotransferase [Candidatus Pacearchaeota archaeon]
DEKIAMFVEHNGYLGKDVKEVREMCTKYNTLMLEDSAQSVGLDGAGKYGDISIFSFSTPKMITTGQGGAILTDNEEYYDSCCNMKDQGGNWRETKIHKEIGLNFKFNDILACLGLSQLNDLENIKKEKKRIFDEYRKYIKLFDFGQEITAMAALIHDKEFYRFANSKTQTFCEISKLYHPITDHLQFKNLGNFPVAQKIYDTVIYLPSSMFLQEEQIKNVYEILTEMDWKKYERME